MVWEALQPVVNWIDASAFARWLGARLAAAGRARVLSHHAWNRSMQRLDGIIERCLAEFGRRSAASVGRRQSAMPRP